MNAFLAILRKKIHDIAKDVNCSDDLVLLEIAAIKGVITFPEFVAFT